MDKKVSEEVVKYFQEAFERGWEIPGLEYYVTNGNKIIEIGIRVDPDEE